MVDHIFTQTREEAVGVGQMLINHGAIRHATAADGPFADGNDLFQFLVQSDLLSLLVVRSAYYLLVLYHAAR